MNVWQTIETEISKTIESDFKITYREIVSGGDINESYRISDGDTEYFVKCNDAISTDMFKAEASGLHALQQTNQFKIPKVITYGNFENNCYLVLEYLNFTGSNSLKLFGEKLAKLHTTSLDRFGFSQDNFIGKTKQLNSWSENWGEFFTENRLAFQIDLLKQKGSNIHKDGNLIELLKILPEFLNSHQPKPSLVHGDLWQGNYGFSENGQPVLYDPACYYADHEVDLAMLELFGNPGLGFFESYKSELEIKPGYSVRKQVYNLYHILNHANLFGGSYEHQADVMIGAILKRF